MRDNFKPPGWGPSAWLFLHTVTMSYPDNPTPKDKENFKTFFETLAEMLPCESCRDHYKRTIKEVPIDRYLDSKEHLFGWLVEQHNRVNMLYGKKTYSIDDAKRALEENYRNILSPSKSPSSISPASNQVQEPNSTSPNEGKHNIVGVVVVMILLIGGGYFYIKKKKSPIWVA